MSTYATIDAFRAYSPAAPTSDEEAQRVLDQAERDLDVELFAPVDALRQATGLKYDPAALEPAWIEGAIERATCAQAEYRLAMGDDFFIRAQHDQVRGPDFTTSGRIPYLAPKAERELSGTGLLDRDDIGSASVESPTVAAYNRVYPPPDVATDQL